MLLGGLFFYLLPRRRSSGEEAGDKEPQGYTFPKAKAKVKFKVNATWIK